MSLLLSNPDGLDCRTHVSSRWAFSSFVSSYEQGLATSFAESNEQPLCHSSARTNFRWRLIAHCAALVIHLPNQCSFCRDRPQAFPSTRVDISWRAHQRPSFERGQTLLFSDSDTVSSRSLYLHEVVLRNDTEENCRGIDNGKIENRLDDYQR